MSWWTNLLTAVAKVFREPPAQPSPTPIPGVPVQPDQVIARRLFDAQNTIRHNAGYHLLNSSMALNNLALRRVSAMAVHNVLPADHKIPGQGSLADSLNDYTYAYTGAGENIARGQPTPEQVLAAWMTSPGHRRNILSPSFDSVGVACRTSSKGTMYWCVVFVTTGAPRFRMEFDRIPALKPINCPCPIDGGDKP